MIWQRTCYGIVEQISAESGSKQITYKIKEKGKRSGTYIVDFEDDIPFIRRYGKKLTLEGFRSEDKKGLTLGSFILGKRLTRKASLYSYMDYQQFIYIKTTLNEIIVRESVLIAKNLISKNNISEDKKKTSVVDFIKEQITQADSDACVINGFEAKRIRV